MKIPDRIFIRNALMFIISDVFTNYVTEFEGDIKDLGIQFKHDVKYHYNNFTRAIESAKKEASLFMNGMLSESTERVLNNLFEDSDAFNALFKVIVDRIVGEDSNGEVIRQIHAYANRFRSSNLFPELEKPLDAMKKFQLGMCCDMVRSCPLANSDFKDANGYTYSIYYCRGMFKNCARRKIRVVKGMKAVPKDLLPDGTSLGEGKSVFDHENLQNKG